MEVLTPIISTEYCDCYCHPDTGRHSVLYLSPLGDFILYSDIGGDVELFIDFLERVAAHI